jgi:beta-mannosidase
MFKQTTGVITWMSNPAQPSFVWQLYHYDLEPNASLYATKGASEAVHVQLNEALSHIELVNNRPSALTDLKVRSTIYRLDGSIDAIRTYPVASVPASSTVDVSPLTVNSRITPLYFVKLDLLDNSANVLSTNFYWQNVAQDDFTGLQGLPIVALNVSATSLEQGGSTLLKVSVGNPTQTVALMAHLQLRRKASGKRVLPVFYSDNYVSLVPGESRTITIEAATKDLKGEAPLIVVDGYNIDVKPMDAVVSIAPNYSAQPERSPSTNIVPDEESTTYAVKSPEPLQ